MATWVQRMIGAAKLDVGTYEEVEHDQGAMGQAMGVVVLSAVAAGIGGFGKAGGVGFLAMTVGALVGWFVWAFLTWAVGTKLLAEEGTEADMGQLLRTIGFSSSPGILRALGFIPILGALVTLVASFWMLATMVIAVRQALDYKSTGRAVGVCLLGFLVNMAVAVAVGMMLGMFVTKTPVS